MIAYDTPDTLKVLTHHMTKFQNLPFSWYWTRAIASSQATLGPVHALHYSETPRLEAYPDYYDRYLQRATPFLAKGEAPSPYTSTLDADAFRFEPGFVVLSPCAVFLPKDTTKELPKRFRLKGISTWIWFNYEVSQLLLPHREMIREGDWTHLKPILSSILLQAFDYFYVGNLNHWETIVKTHPRLNFYEWYEKQRTVPRASLEEISRGGDVYEILKTCMGCLKLRSDCVCGKAKKGKTMFVPPYIQEIR